MTIPIRRSRLGIALLFPVIAVRVGGIFVTNSSGQRFVGFDVPDVAISIVGWLFLAGGLVGILALIPQLIDPKIGVQWDEESVTIRAGIGLRRRADWDNIRGVAASRGIVQAVRIEVEEGPHLVVPVWLLDLPEGWTAQTLADRLSR